MDQELVAFLDERFGKIDERFSKVDERFAKMDENFRSLRDDMNQRFERVEEAIRHTQVMVEGVRGDIRLVAEGTYGLDERLGSFRKEVQQEFEDVRKLIRPVYSSLDQRIRTLEVRKDLQGRDPIELIKERFGLGKKAE
jgi:archaellum component FlaC